MSIKNRRMLIYSNILTRGGKFLTPATLCQFLKSFTMPNLREMEITIDFNGNLGHLWDVITH